MEKEVADKGEGTFEDQRLDLNEGEEEAGASSSSSSLSLEERYTVKLGEKAVIYDVRINDTKTLKLAASSPSDAKEANQVFTLYNIELYSVTSAQPQIVRKRFSDFITFHKMLQKKFAKNRLPLLPSKAIFRNSLEPQLISSRKDQLEKYLRELLCLKTTEEEEEEAEEVLKETKEREAKEIEKEKEKEKESEGEEKVESEEEKQEKRRKSEKNVTFRRFMTRLFFNLFDLNERVALIVDAEGTRGCFEVASMFTRLGAHVFIGCSSDEEGALLVERIRKETAQKRVEYMRLDLASLSSVEQFAQDFLAKNLPLHYLVNIPAPSSSSDSEFKGFLGTSLLTRLLQERLEQSAPSRVVNICPKAVRLLSSSRSDLLATASALDRGNNLMPRAGEELQKTNKMASLMLSYELGRRLRGTGVVAHSLGLSPLFLACDKANSVKANAFMKQPLVKWMTAGREQHKVTLMEDTCSLFYCLLSRETGSQTGFYWEDCLPVASDPLSLALFASPSSSEDDPLSLLWRNCEASTSQR
ncbi:retinol dehydrogenase 12 (all-trans 9-cis 11-cis) [Balamuthia mandrillaris]